MLLHIGRPGSQFSQRQPAPSMSIEICMAGANFHPSTRENAPFNSSDAATERCLPERQNTTTGTIGPPVQFLKTLLRVR